MKLYTLEYDCNLPTTQQVNVATNTDAKIGIKVKKNGEYLSLDGSTLSVVTPNTTISADAELTNGYVTFPITTPDTASYVQDTVVVNIEPVSLSATASKAIPIPAAVKGYTINLPASDLSGAAGMKLFAEDIKLYYSALSSDTTGTEISGYNGNCWYVGVYNSSNQITYGGYIGTNAGIEKKWYKNLTPENILPTYDTTPRDFAELQEGDWLRVVIGNKADTLPAYTSSEKYTHIDITARKDGFNANFKLNVNTFKSQQGDKDYIGELPYIPSKTITIAGTYTDNTSFSYDVYYKD